MHADPEGIEVRGAIRIIVSDDGPGIEASELPHIFEQFYRSPYAEATNTAGSGLGLSLAEDLAAANGGRAEVPSTIGQGVVASLLLPAAHPDLDELLLATD